MPNIDDKLFNEAITRITLNQIALFNLLALFAEKMTGESPIVDIGQPEGGMLKTSADRTSVSWSAGKSY